MSIRDCSIAVLNINEKIQITNAKIGLLAISLRSY